MTSVCEVESKRSSHLSLTKIVIDSVRPAEVTEPCDANELVRPIHNSANNCFNEKRSISAISNHF